MVLQVAPRVVVEPRGVVWVDARGMPARRVAATALRLVRQRVDAAARAAVAHTAIAAEIAAIHPPTRHPSETVGSVGGVLVVPAAGDRRFLASYPISVLDPPSRLVPMLDDVGIVTCGDLARLAQEAVEVRFGSEGVALWRLARADDPREIFGRAPRELPAASAEWMDYTLRDTERLLFVVNRLIASVCVELRSWGEGARAMVLELALADRTRMSVPVRTARATASRATWMRRLRAVLEEVRLPEAVAGITVRVEALAGLEAPQGDLFDGGFTTAGSVDDVVARLIDEHRAAVIALVTTAHPLPEQRLVWQEAPGLPAFRSGRRAGGGRGAERPAQAHLAVQLLPEPRRIDVVVASARRRGARVPMRYRDGDRVVPLRTVVGPDWISGVDGDRPYAREYFHAITEDGVLVLLFRDARAEGGAWYLHGWWD